MLGLMAFKQRSQEITRCHTHLVTMCEVCKLFIMALLPWNRNVRRLQARTHLLALVDVDMLMGGGLYKDLQEDREMAKQVC